MDTVRIDTILDVLSNPNNDLSDYWAHRILVKPSDIGPLCDRIKNWCRTAKVANFQRLVKPHRIRIFDEENDSPKIVLRREMFAPGRMVIKCRMDDFMLIKIIYGLSHGATEMEVLRQQG